jgi:hypothetical protein
VHLADAGAGGQDPNNGNVQIFGTINASGNAGGPKASERTLLVLSGPGVMCRKNIRCTPICVIASTASATGMLGLPYQISARD